MCLYTSRTGPGRLADGSKFPDRTRTAQLQFRARVLGLRFGGWLSAASVSGSMAQRIGRPGLAQFQDSKELLTVIARVERLARGNRDIITRERLRPALFKNVSVLCGEQQQWHQHAWIKIPLVWRKGFNTLWKRSSWMKFPASVYRYEKGDGSISYGLLLRGPLAEPSPVDFKQTRPRPR